MNDVIILRSVYGKVNQIYYIQPCVNPKTGKLPDCVKTVDSNGDMILSEKDKADMSSGQKHFVPANFTFEIVDGTTFDLSDVVDKARWEAIQYCNWIAKDRFERDSEGNLLVDGGAKRYGVADLYVERPGEITKAKITKKQLVHRASTYIYEDSERERIKKCKVLGRDMRFAIPADILDFLIDKAEREPKKIIELYEGEDWKLRLFLVDALEKGVIRRADGIYKYDDTVLGGSEDAVIIFLRDFRYKKLIDSIKRETYPELLTKDEIKAIQEDLKNPIIEEAPEIMPEVPKKPRVVINAK
jgi:hypothetical protein